MRYCASSSKLRFGHPDASFFRVAGFDPAPEGRHTGCVGTRDSNRTALLRDLLQHRAHNSGEAESLLRLVEFVENVPECFERTHLAGHVTGSAWVVDRSRTRALLVLHRKLGVWLQPGGHCDGELDVLDVARRELVEETGVATAVPASVLPFDIDVHEIPERHGERAHFHYDIRYLFEADPSVRLQVSAESRDVRWFAASELSGPQTDASVRRMAEKSLPAAASADR